MDAGGNYKTHPKENEKVICGTIELHIFLVELTR